MTDTRQLMHKLKDSGVELVAVSKTKPLSAILGLYEMGQRVFGENRVQELVEKHEKLPQDIEWHMIGHLQRNKVKYIAPFVHLIHAVDSERLLLEIDRQAEKNERVIPVLLQVHIARETEKFGFSIEELTALLEGGGPQALKHVQIRGLMGMATFTDDEEQVRAEFASLKQLFDQLADQFFSEREDFTEISMGMSGDYQIAVEQGSTMVRIGSLIFGARS